MIFAENIGMYDELKPKFLLSLLKEYVPDDKHPFRNSSDLSYVVTTIMTHKLLLERGLIKQELMDCWKKAVDSWDNRVRSLLASHMPTDKRGAGIILLGVTCRECSSERFLASYFSWFNELLNHIQLPASSPFVKVAAFASLSDLFIRLSRFPEAKKDGTSLALKVVEPTLKILNAESSCSEELLSLLCTLMNFFPVPIHRHYDDVEAAIVSKIMFGEHSASVLKKLSYGLSLLPKSRGDEDIWVLMMKILLSINSHLSDAFQGLDEDSSSSEAIRVVLLSGKGSPPPLGGLAVPEQTYNVSTRRPERLLGSTICALMSCCSMMLTNLYLVQDSVLICGIVALARRVLLVDGSLSQKSFSSMTTLKQEFICLELPLLQLHTLQIITAVIKCLSQGSPHAADILLLLTQYMRRCTFPELRVGAYSIMKVLLMSMGFGTAIHVIPDVMSIVFDDLDRLACKKDDTSSKATKEVLTKSRRKRKKHSSVTGSFQEQPVKDIEVEMPQISTSISVKIAALDVLEALLSRGGYWKFDSWRPKVNHLLITLAANTCKGGWSNEESGVFISGEPSVVWADFQLALLRALYASLNSSGRTCPSHLASGMQEMGTKLADYCGHALDGLICPGTHPMVSTRLSNNDYKGHKFPDTSYATGQSQLSTFQVGIQGKDLSESESEDDDLYENWVKNDNDEMEMQVTETQKNANDAAKPLATTIGTSGPLVSEEQDLGVSTSSRAEKIMVGGNDFTVESPISETTKKQRRDGAPSTSSNHLLTGAQSDAVTSERAAFKPVGQDIAVESNLGNGVFAKDEMKASMSEQLMSETKIDDSSTIVERISAILSRSDKSRGLTFESDNESVDSIPEIVDGDPDSD